MSEILCGNASDNLYLTFKGSCRKDLTYKEAYRCTGCGGRFHKDCILEHFKLEEKHDWGRQEERKNLVAKVSSCIPNLSPDDITKLESLLLADTDPDADYTVKTATFERPNDTTESGENAKETEVSS